MSELNDAKRSAVASNEALFISCGSASLLLACGVAFLVVGPEIAGEVQVLEPVTNQVTTAPGNARQSATYTDTDILLTCGNPTQPDAIVRNWHAW